MAWKIGQSGNPGGTVREKKFLAALERAVLADDGAKLRRAAQKLLDAASEGESWAIAQLADRLDGKAVQVAEVSVTDSRVDELSDNELLRLAAAGSNRTPEAQSVPQVTPRVH